MRIPKRTDGQTQHHQPYPNDYRNRGRGRGRGRGRSRGRGRYRGGNWNNRNGGGGWGNNNGYYGQNRNGFGQQRQQTQPSGPTKQQRLDWEQRLKSKVKEEWAQKLNTDQLCVRYHLGFQCGRLLINGGTDCYDDARNIARQHTCVCREAHKADDCKVAFK